MNEPLTTKDIENIPLGVKYVSPYNNSCLSELVEHWEQFEKHVVKEIKTPVLREFAKNTITLNDFMSWLSEQKAGE